MAHDDRIDLAVSVDGEQILLTQAKWRKGDNPSGIAKEFAEALRNLAGRMNDQLVTAYGDVRTGEGVTTSTALYLSRAQVADRISVAEGALSRYKLPAPDAVIGPINDDGSVPRGSFRGWLPETIDEWNANRPGRGARTDLKGSDASD